MFWDNGDVHEKMTVQWLAIGHNLLHTKWNITIKVYVYL